MPSIKNVVNRNVVAIKSDQSIEEIARILIKNKLSGVPVKDDKDNLVGYLSERDVIASISRGNFANKKARDIMTKKVISVEEGTSLECVSQIFTEHPIRNVPVTKKRKITGVILHKDIIQRLMGQYY